MIYMIAIACPSLLRKLSSPYFLCLVRDLVQAHDSDTQNVPSFRDRCDNLRRRTFQNVNSVATPIFYRSQLFPPLSPESPAFLVDILKPNADVDSGEWSAHFTVYNMTHRCDMESRWLGRLQKLLTSQDRTGRSSHETPSAPSEMEPSLFKVSSRHLHKRRHILPKSANVSSYSFPHRFLFRSQTATSTTPRQ